MTSSGCDLYYGEIGEGVPILLIHPAGSFGVDLGLRDRRTRADRTSDQLRPSRVRPFWWRTRAIDVHARRRRRNVLEDLGTPPAVVVGTRRWGRSGRRRSASSRAGTGCSRPRVPLAIHSTPPYGSAGRDIGQDRMADPTGPSQRRRRDTAAVRLLVSRRWNRVGCLSRGVASGGQGKRKGGSGGLPQLDRCLSVPGRSRDRRGSRRVHLRCAEPRRHVPPRPITRGCHSRSEYAPNRRRGPLLP